MPEPVITPPPIAAQPTSVAVPVPPPGTVVEQSSVAVYHKPGVKTSEFWLTVIAQVVLFLNTSEAWHYMPQRYSGAIQGAILIAYTLSRAWVKSNPPPPK